MAFERGTVIAGKYRVERVIGEGGMGIVLAARHLGLDEMVAVKLIREEVAEGTGALARFQREARAAARIKSEHVARVLDVDALPEADGRPGAPYIVMELIDGVDLDALLKRRGALPADEAASYIVQACEGLAEAHALGMVHRDLKLKNLFLTRRRDGRALIKVIDFGVVKLAPTTDEMEATLPIGSAFAGRAPHTTLTQSSMLVGSVHYMAPEQIRASNVVTAQADVWSLGVCLFCMLTGRLPFDGETIGEVCAAIQGRPIVDVRSLSPAVERAVADVVTKALEKDVRRRFANVAELAHALAPFSLDPAGAARVTTILESGAEIARPPLDGAASDAPDGSEATRTEAFGGRGPGGATVTSAPAPARVRMESTIEAAAVASVETVAPPTNRRVLPGLLLMVGATALTLGVWGRARLFPGAWDAVRTPQPRMEVAGAASAAILPASAAPPALPVPSAVVLVPASGAASPSAGPRPSKRSLARPVKASGANATPATPKTEPSSAYDQF